MSIKLLPYHTIPYRPETSCIRFALKFCVVRVFEVYCKQSNKNIIFISIIAPYCFEIAVKWSKSQISIILLTGPYVKTYHAYMLACSWPLRKKFPLH